MIFALAFGLSAFGALARADEIRFDVCIPAPGEKTEIAVEHAGVTYPLRTEPCRELFLSDPERYAQLYEALLELARSGEPAATPLGDSVSLVPS